MTDNHIGYTLYISEPLPATNDAAGFEALTWTKINGLVQGPQFGFTHANIDIPDLEIGDNDAVKGAGSGQDTTIQCRRVASDTGQTTVKERSDDGSGTCALKLVMGTGTDQAPTAGDYVEYAQGYLHSYLPNQPSTTSYEGFSVNFKQRKRTVIATEPA